MICCNKEMRQTKLGYYVCENCGKQIEDDFGLIKKTLDAHPGANVIDIVNYTGLPPRVVLKCLNDGLMSTVKTKPMLSQNTEVKATWHTKRRRRFGFALFRED